jgi:hypothetical protein
MKSCGAAALALVSWYLMVPAHPLTSKPFAKSEWSVYQVYNSSEKCRRARQDIIDGWLKDAQPDFFQRFGNSFKQTFNHGMCVSSDDRWLKGS